MAVCLQRCRLSALLVVLGVANLTLRPRAEMPLFEVSADAEHSPVVGTVLAPPAGCGGDGHVPYMCREVLGNVSCAACWRPIAEPSDSVIDIGTRKQLLIDDFAIAKMDGIDRRYGHVGRHFRLLGVGMGPEAQRHSITLEYTGPPCHEPALSVIRSTHPLFGNESVLLGWYLCNCNRVCLTVSLDDGVQWNAWIVGSYIRPNTEHHNNANIQGIRDGTFAVTYDDSASRFLVAFQCYTAQICVASSVEGNQIMPQHGGIVSRDYLSPATINQLHWDSRIQRHRLITGQLIESPISHEQVRGVAQLTNEFLLSEQSRILQWERRSGFFLDDARTHGAAKWHLKSFSIFEYEAHCLGIVQIHHFAQDLSEGEADAAILHERDVVDVYIAHSRDCESWDLSAVFAGEPLVRRGIMDHGIMQDQIYTSNGPVLRDDAHEVFFYALNERSAVLAAGTVPTVRYGFRGRLRLDGFAYLTARADEGSVVTRAFKVVADYLQFNYRAGLAGSVFAELLDEHYASLAGFGRAEACRFEPPEGSLRQLACWRNADGAKTERLPVGRIVRVRFVLVGTAHLYSFSITQQHAG